MANNANYNKIIVNGVTKLDLTGDTITPDKLAAGITAHDKSGTPIEGTNTFDANTSDANAAAAEILSGKTAYVRGSKVTGTMQNKGGVQGSINTKDGQYTIPQGYHDGSGKVGIDAVEKAKIVPANIREGITILGIPGEMSGTEDASPQAKTVTSSFVDQVVSPDSPDYNYLSQVTVKAIPVTETDNDAGGKTLTVG